MQTFDLCISIQKQPTSYLWEKSGHSATPKFSALSLRIASSNVFPSLVDLLDKLEFCLETNPGVQGSKAQMAQA